MKTFAACMLAAGAAAFDPDFMAGIQKGAFVMGDDAIYGGANECPHVTLTPQVLQITNMAKPALMMMQNMNQGQEIPFIHTIEQAIDEFGLLFSLWTGYEGSEFCKGMILAHEVASFALKAGQRQFAKYTSFLDKDAIN